MRITNSMMNNRMINNINNNLSRLDQYYSQMTTNQKIQVPSDNPIIASRSLKYRNIVKETNQYKENSDQAQSWMEITESAFKNMNSVMSKMSELCVQGGTDTNDIDARKKILGEFCSLTKQLETELNTKYMGRYVFSGYKTDQPVIREDGTLNPDIYDDTDILNQNIELEVGSNNRININSVAPDFYTKDIYDDLHSFDEKLAYFSSDAFNNLNDSQKAAKEDELRQDFDNMIGKLKGYADTISKEHADTGVRMNRLALVQNRLSEDSTNYTNLMSKNEDVNLGEVTMKFNVANSVYNASLKVGMNLLQLSLADYL